MRTIPEVISDMKSILNNIERTEECTGETLVDIDELANEILSINSIEKHKIFEELDKKSFSVDFGQTESMAVRLVDVEDMLINQFK